MANVLLTGARGYCGPFIQQALEAAGHGIMHDLVEKVDAVVHMGARSSGTALDFLNNILTTQKVIDAARGVKIIHFSSVSVHGAIADGICSYKSGVVNPSPYGISKRMSELLLEDRGQALSLRLPGIIGPRSVRNWLSVTRQKALAHEAITYSNPDLDFNNAVHISDLAAFVVKLVEMRWPPSVSIRAFPLASTWTESVRNVVARVAPAAEALPLPRPGHFIINDTHAREAWGWAPLSTAVAISQFVQENPMRAMAAQ